jgi:hypothetical protein
MQQMTRARKKRITLVGDFIRNKRQQMQLSQQRLGQLLSPPVTTQFMSNIERGITPLPCHHISGIAKALKVKEQELSALLEREIQVKFLGKVSNFAKHATETLPSIHPREGDFIYRIYSAYQAADEVTQKTFEEVSAALLKIKIKAKASDSES